jgi:DNA-binding transcriptional LysR family regulator
VELHQLRCFVAVAEELHFGKAAKRLYITQPPLSRQIQLLEHSLGVVLFDRGNRQVNLTAAGHVFLRDARRMLALAEQAELVARRTAKGELGRFTVGFTAVSGYRMIPNLLSHVAKRLPDIEVALQEMVSTAQIDALLGNMIDLGFVRQPIKHDAVLYSLVSSEPLRVVLPLGHPLTHKHQISIHDLDSLPFIMYTQNEGRYFYDCIAGLFALAGVTPRYIHYLGQTHSILGLVRAGLGVAIVPASAQELHQGHIEFRGLTDVHVNAEMYMAYRRDNYNPILPAFTTLVQSLSEYHAI